MNEKLGWVRGYREDLVVCHSKGGFTSLIASLPMLLSEVTPELVMESLSTVSVSHQKKWVDKNLGKTLCSQRNQAYKESRTATIE